MPEASFTLSISSLAFSDINEASVWYESKSEGLGFHFLLALEETYKSILSHPFAYPRHKKGGKVRKKLIQTFPYKVFYIVDNTEVNVIAVVHNARAGKFIRDRLK